MSTVEIRRPDKDHRFRFAAFEVSRPWNDSSQVARLVSVSPVKDFTLKDNDRISLAIRLDVCGQSA
jgi:hypothetical protein